MEVIALIIVIIIIFLSKQPIKLLPRSVAIRKLPLSKGWQTPRTFSQYQEALQTIIMRSITTDDFHGECDSVKYVLQEGKRLRPIILMEIARIRKAPPPFELAVAVEYLHGASVIVDDLPAFDNDPMRRGKDSLWVHSSIANAQMIASMMVAGAFKCVCRNVDSLRIMRSGINADLVGSQMCSLISDAMGEASFGQLLDTSTAGGYNIEATIQKKTSPFFEIAFVGGWLASGGDYQLAYIVRDVGRMFGTAFQIADDISDMDQDRARQAENKPGWNLALSIGKESAENLVITRLECARTLMQKLDIWSPLMGEIFTKVLKLMLS